MREEPSNPFVIIELTCPLQLHDLGTGPGLVAESLSPYFTNVVATDASDNYTAIASIRLSRLPNGAQFTVRTSRAEDLPEWVPAASVDMVTMAEAIHWADSAAVVSAAAECLRIGGTLAVWDYGVPVFDFSYKMGQGEEGKKGEGKGGVGEEKVDESTRAQEKRCQALLQEIIERTFDRMRPSFAGGPFERCAVMLRSFMDNVAFSEEHWQHVRRLKWNADHPLEVLDHKQLDFEVPYVSQVTDREEVVEMRDRGFWGLEADVAWLRGYVEHIAPGRETDEGKLKKIEELWGDLKREMGGRKWITWTAVLLLATRR